MALYKKTYQGKFKPRNPKKYKGDPRNIVYRSSWEQKMMIYCDRKSSVVQWASEERCCIVPYKSPVDGKMHRYFIDFWFKMRNPKTGEEKEFLIEVKPKKYTKQPKPRQRKTRQYVEECMNWEVNQAKWDAAREYARQKNMTFMIFTEDQLT